MAYLGGTASQCLTASSAIPLSRASSRNSSLNVFGLFVAPVVPSPERTIAAFWYNSHRRESCQANQDPLALLSADVSIYRSFRLVRFPTFSAKAASADSSPWSRRSKRYAISRWFSTRNSSNLASSSARYSLLAMVGITAAPRDRKSGGEG